MFIFGYFLGFYILFVKHSNSYDANLFFISQYLQANEEYEIEKASVVRSETAAIDALYERKYKQSKLSQQIAKSTVANKARLKVLEAREDVVTSIFEEASAQLANLTKDTDKYKKVIEGLIEEAALQLLEPSIKVKCKKGDASVVKSVLDDVVKYYKDATKGKELEAVVDEESFLGDNIAGGVIVSNKSGKIEVNNTFDERLKLLQEQSLPAIRLAVFGPSESRKFFN